MPVETDADRLQFLDTDAFGVEATYKPVTGGAASTIKGIFDAASTAIEVGLEVSISSTSPQFHCRTSDLTNGGKQRDTFVIAGVTYKAKDVQPDGTGMTMVMLERQS